MSRTVDRWNEASRLQANTLGQSTDSNIPLDALGNGTGSSMLLRPRDAAKALCISERTLWSLTKNGDLPAVRIGKCVRYSPSDLAEWISHHRSTDTKAA